MLDREMTSSLWDHLLPGLETVTYFHRKGSATPDDYFSYTVTVGRKKSGKREVSFGDGVFVSVDLRFEFWRELLGQAVALDGGPTPPPDPAVDDYIMDADGVGYTLLKLNKGQLFGNVLDWDATNRD